MSTMEMNPQFAGAVKNELAAIGSRASRLQRHQRRVRALAICIAVIAAAVVASGAAIVASQVPGSTVVTPLGGGVTVTHTGTGTLDLGPRPAHVGSLVLTVTCLNVGGSISIKTTPQNPGDGFEIETYYCKGYPTTWHGNDGLPPKPGSTTITITADPGTEWRVTAQYASAVTTAWGVNAHGQTYGECDANGCPDLWAVQQLPTQEGYVYIKQFDAFKGNGYLPVYASDGTTVIGRFAIGIPNSGLYGYGGSTLPPSGVGDPSQ